MINKNFLRKSFVYLFFLLSILYFLRVFQLGGYPDFSTNYFGPIVNSRNENPYIGGAAFFTKYIYPPTIIILYYPFTIFNLHISQYIFTSISVICLLFSIFLMFKIFDRKPFTLESLMLISLALIFFPTKFTLGMGQINNIILLMTSLFIYYFYKKEDKLSGVFLSISLALKFFPLLIIYLILIKKRWKVLISLILSSVVIGLATFLVVRPDTVIYFLTNIFPNIIGSIKSDYYSQSLSAFLWRETGSFELARLLNSIISIVMIGVSMFFTYKYRSSKRKELLLIGLIITLSLVINTFSWQHHFVWALIPLYFCFEYMRMNKIDKKLYVPLVASYVLMGINLKNPLLYPSLIQSHVLYGAIILMGINVYLLTIKRLK